MVVNKMKLKNIIFVTDDCGIVGGGPKVQTFEANYFSQFYNVVYFCGFITSKECMNPNIKIISVYETSFLKNPNRLKGAMLGLYSKKAQKMLTNLLKDYSPEDTIIHVQGYVSALSSSVFKPIYKSKIPVFYTLHAYHLVCPNGGFYNFPKSKICTLKPGSLKCRCSNCDSRSYLFKIYRLVRRVFEKHFIKVGKNNIHYIFLSRLSYEKMIDYLKPKVEYRFIHNPIESRNITVNNIENNHSYLFVGRVTKEKGIVELCDYVDRLGLDLNIVGSGNLLEDLENKYKENKHIRFHGWQNYDYINKMMLESRALIFPSLWYECEPLTVLEAKSAGLPVLVSSLCASVEDVTEKSGMIFNPYSFDEFSNSIKVFENDKALKEMSINAKKEFDEYEMNNKHYDELLKFYNDVLESSDE